MKARIKSTGEIVTVISYENYAMSPKIKTIAYLIEGNFTETNGSENFEILPDEPETLTTSFDWETFRNETAAKLFLLYEQVFPYSSSNTKTSIGTTDELIRQLKETTMP
jgi:hypothetical protein